MPTRWLLHPATAAVALAVVALAVAAGPRHLSGSALLLVAGAAAGFANSGST